jgi:hypothetical protein
MDLPELQPYHLGNASWRQLPGWPSLNGETVEIASTSGSVTSKRLLWNRNENTPRANAVVATPRAMVRHTLEDGDSFTGNCWMCKRDMAVGQTPIH